MYKLIVSALIFLLFPATTFAALVPDRTVNLNSYRCGYYSCGYSRTYSLTPSPNVPVQIRENGLVNYRFLAFYTNPNIAFNNRSDYLRYQKRRYNYYNNYYTRYYNRYYNGYRANYGYSY